MKHQFLSLLSRSELTNFATALANANVDGFKAKTKHIISAIAQMEGKSPEALLASRDELHKDAFEFRRKNLSFSRNGKLVEVYVSVKIGGCQTETLSMHTGTSDEDGYVSDVTVSGALSNGGASGDVDKATIRRNTKIALNHLFELEEWINANKRTITPEEGEKRGFEIQHYGFDC